MPISWNEIRARAAHFSKEWKSAHYEKGQTQTFYNEFFEVFGRRRRDVAVYEEKVKKLNNKQGFIDLFWPGQLLIEQKSAGRNLASAREQATDYFLSLKELEKPRYILLSDFQTFELLDLETQAEHHFTLTELADKVKLFDFVAGYHRQQYKDQDPVNIEAASLMSALHEQLEESGYKGAHLERLLVRIMFCLFADDTGIFEPEIFLRFIEDHTNEDGSDLGSKLIHLFEILDTSEKDRQRILDEDLARFPYVNGQLFADLIRTPSFNRDMREALLQCCYFDWSKVSPALFGSLFQAVLLPEEQRKGGAHYTSERNILKTIHPLFLDELQKEFQHLRDSRGTQRKVQLERFHTRLGTLTFLDPACGCGNFLILAYRELRLVEIEVLEALYPAETRNQVLDVSLLSRVDVDQFYGIEIEEFPARIAEAAMWLVDHQMNMRLSESFGQAFVRLPLKKSAHIHHKNALRVDWKTIIEPDRLSYMLGNPPFVGHQYRSGPQMDDMRLVWGNEGKVNRLDYVTAWYWRAADYIQNTKIKVAFVSTNSITQGEQEGILWQPIVMQFGIHIHFAHRTFKWTIDEKKAKGMKLAAVHAVIVGFAAYDTDEKYLYEYDTATSDPHKVSAKNINGYLTDAPDVFLPSRTKPRPGLPKITKGSQATDGGHLLLSDSEKEDLIKREPEAAKWIKRFIGADELIYDIPRWCLWLKGIAPDELKRLPLVRERTNNVRAERLKSPTKSVKDFANFPTLFTQDRQPASDYLAIPRHSSETRFYIPMRFSSKNVIAGDALIIIPNAGLYHFAILTSVMHMVWMKETCGRLESRYRYSSAVYDNYPFPQNLSPADVTQLEKRAQAVLDARAQYPNSNLANLYDPETMPPPLFKAHQALDQAVDAAYRKQRFENDRQRLEFLFNLYHHQTAPLIMAMTKASRKRR